jgi:acetylornithine deacetylase/succinyl-diaminopimelate desuccinylase-like protein
MLAPNRPAITYAMRGALSMELEVCGPELDLHDGLFGGAAPNPAQGLCEMVASLQSIDGLIKIPGFYKTVRKVEDEERLYMSRTGRSEEILQTARARMLWTDLDYTPYERITIQPSLAVTGITAGYQGSGPKSIIPARASAKLNFRLVPDQTPTTIEPLIRKHVAGLTPHNLRSRLKKHFACSPFLISPKHPMMRAATLASEKTFGRRAVFLRSGGSNPAVTAFQEILGVPTILLGLGLPNDQIHAPNEKFHLPSFYLGINTIINFLNEVGLVGKTLVKNKSTTTYFNSTAVRAHSSAN